jgi:Histone methylation protein DOT1
MQRENVFSLFQLPLVPEKNPNANPEACSSSGVNYQSVFDGLSVLYPDQEWEQRNALSRTNAYWPYIQTGDTPPEELIYGEFDFFFFAELLDRACLLWDLEHEGEIHDDKVFCDLGSGSGRLVLAAAALNPWQLCRGVELLPGIHMVAVDNLALCRNDEGDGALPSSWSTTSSDSPSFPMSPVEFICGSFEDPYVYFGDSDIVFVFSSCMGADLVQAGLGQAIGRQCRPGTIVITTDYRLPLEGTVPPDPRDDRLPSGTYRFGLIEQLEGWCWLTGGSSIAFIHRVEESLWEEGRGRLEPLELSLQDKALDVVHALESGKLTDTKAFLRNVRNNMIFYGFPESFLPPLK